MLSTFLQPLRSQGTKTAVCCSPRFDWQRSHAPGRPTRALRSGVSSTTSMISFTKSARTSAVTSAGSRSFALKIIASSTVACTATALLPGFQRVGSGEPGSCALCECEP